MAPNSREAAPDVSVPAAKKRTGRRLRGWFIRLVLNRTVSIALGLVLLVPAVWMFAGNYSWETPITDGLQLILGATAAALLLAGIGGRRPDWIDPGDP